jgi:hypothetical protein
MLGPSTASATTAFAHGTRFVHHQRPAEKVLAIAVLHGAVRLFIVAELREAEAARVAGEFIADDLNRVGVEASP